MAGKPRGPVARSEVLRIRITPDGMAALDRARGQATRSDFVRDLLTRHIAATR